MPDKQTTVAEDIASAPDAQRPLVGRQRELGYEAYLQVIETVKWGMPVFSLEKASCHMKSTIKGGEPGLPRF